MVFGQMNEPPGRPPARGAVGAHDGRVLPRPDRRRHAALHRQHLPLHAGRLRSVGAARPHALRRGLPADARHGDGRAAGAHHLDQARRHHVDPGHLRARRRLHRPGAGHRVRPPRQHGEPGAQHRREGHLPGGGPARLQQPHHRARVHRRASTTGWPARCSRSSSATATCRTSSRSSASTSCPRRTSSSSAARARSSASSSQPFFVAEQFTGMPGIYCSREDTIRSFDELCDGKWDHLPDQAFMYVGAIEEAAAAGRAPGGGQELGRARQRHGGKSDTFHCSVITPERAVLETEATFVAFPAHDGEVGILREPRAAALQDGIRRAAGGEPRGQPRGCSSTAGSPRWWRTG